MDAKLVNVRVQDDGVARVALARPQAFNALSRALIDALAEALAALDAAPEARVILLHGEGRHFCAGADIKDMAGLNLGEALRTGFTGCCHALASVSKPVVAAVHGYALGGGCELVEMCDVVVATEDAVFGHPEVTVGTMPGAGGTQRLPRVLGKHKAMDLLLTGRFLTASEAERCGLVSRVAGPGAALDEAAAVAGRIAGMPQPVVRMIKQAVRAAFDSPLAEGLERERGLFHRTLALEDSREGMDAFRAKRPPRFRDR